MSADRLLAPMFEPLAIKGLTLPNRFVLPAMQRGWCRGGVPDPGLGAYYRARVEGGAALVISEALAIDHPSATGQAAAAQLAPHTLSAWQAIVDTVKEAGGNMFLQLFHEGALRPLGQEGTLSPSGLAWAGKANGKAADAGELDEIVYAYAEAARAAQAMGVDGVEIHGAHGFLLDQFCWHETNLRDDGLGGRSLADRLAFPARVVAAIRSEVGAEFIIGWRMSQWKEVDFGARLFDTPAELGQAVGILEAAGVDLFHASTRRFYLPDMADSDLTLAGWISRLGSSPVITVGSIGVGDLLFGLPGDTEALDPLASLTELDRRFRAGEFDLAAVGRAMIADPDWVRKVGEGQLDEIVPFSADILAPGDIDWDMDLVMQGLSRFT